MAPVRTPCHALGAPPAHFDLVKNGVADVAFGVHAYTPNRFKLTEMGELPFTADHSVVNSLAYWRTYSKHFAKHNEHEGTHLLGLWTNGPYQLFTKANAFTSLDAVNGIKIRIPGATVDRITKALGMTPISSPLTEAYEQISRGVIQGMFQQKETVIAFNMTQHMPVASFVPGGFAHSSQFMVVNEAKWKGLEARDRDAIAKLSGEAMVRRFAAIWEAKEAAALAKFAETGVKVTNVEGKLLEELRTGEIDCAILAEPFPDTNLAIAPLYDEPFMAAVPSNHPLAARSNITAEELKKETMLLLGTGHCFRDHVLEVCPEFARFSSNAEGIRKSFEGSSLETIKHMVAAGMGVTLVPRLSVPKDALTAKPARTKAKGKEAAELASYITYLPFEGHVPTRRVVLAWRRSFTRYEAIAALRNAIYACELPGVTRLS